MQLKIINSNSKGNCYILKDNDGKILIIECGVAIDKIKEAINFDVSSVVGCILTHEHLDHCKSAKQLTEYGITIYTSTGTKNALRFESRRVVDIMELQTVNIGPYKIKPFNVKHDCAEPFGYLIMHPEMGTTLFMTDTYYCEYIFPGLNNIIIEANYCQKIIDRKLAASETNGFVRDRVIQSHMSIQTCVKTLKDYDLTKVFNIVVIHLSDSNSDEAQFYKEIKEATACTVTIANKGMEIPFDKSPF